MTYTQREMYVTSLRRPSNYSDLPEQERWEIDKKLGILDWDGKVYPCLSYGLNAELPDSVTVAWGARLIFPDDLVADRQDVIGRDTPEAQELFSWLNEERSLRKALMAAREMTAGRSGRNYLSPSDNKVVVLYEDAKGIIKGNPNMSHGYLYVVGYLKEAER